MARLQRSAAASGSKATIRSRYRNCTSADSLRRAMPARLRNMRAMIWRFEADTPGQFHKYNCECDRDALAVIEHFIDVTVGAVVVIGPAAVESIFHEQILSQGFEPRHIIGVLRQSPGQVARHLRHFGAI